MSKILTDAGWELAEDRPVLYEPESNVIGFFTRGRNVTWVPEHQAARHPNYKRMFDSDGLFAAFRKGALAGQEVRYGVLVIDVGAYTTDFAYVVFDSSFYDDAKNSRIVQVSEIVGVRELDHAVLQQLQPEVQEVISRRPVSEWERMKMQLFNNRPQAVPKPGGGILKVGEGTEATMIANTVKKFAQRVVRASKAFCLRDEIGHINAQVLTGGGMLIPLVREALVKAMKADKNTYFHDLLERPPQVRRWRDGKWCWSTAESDIESELRQNGELVRAGSAIGGSSIFFGKWP